MRGTSREVTQTALTLILGVFVVLAIYTFGSLIFKAGARITVTQVPEGAGCACVAESADAKMECIGEQKACSPCAKENNKCKKEQSIDVESEITYAIRDVEATAFVSKADMYVDGEKVKSCSFTLPFCSMKHSFAAAKKVKEIKVTSDSEIKMLSVFWK